ncbi:MAG: histidine triad nucleotide-binding protein [Acidimicrobiia bacterium]|jgi:histidine triad (HIT) family protein
MNPGCVFCRIVSRQLPATIVAEHDRFLAFRDINPVAPVHVLIIPSEHVESAAQVADPLVVGELVAFAGQVAASERLDEGWRLVTNVGRNGGQTVFHLHFHLLGGRRMGWPPG